MLAIITDSTCDLRADELATLKVRSVPLYVNFQGKVHRDWADIDPARIIAGVQAGADLPSTSQPSPEDFAKAYAEAVAAGATEILTITISSGISGTFQSANLAAKDATVPVSIVDSQNASAGIAILVRQAARMRDAGASREAIVDVLESMKRHMMVLFSVGTLEYLQKGGRIGRAQAFLGGILKVRPILTLEDGKIAPAAKARGTKKAIAEIVERIKAHAAQHQGELVLDFLHIQDASLAENLRKAIRDAGIEFEDGSLYEIGAVIATHVGPGTFGAYAHVKPA
ncbi:MAG: DegV family protein [Trueperaceae bacterium]|nr:DegV family protein [Trueperaceae bacterium]